MFGDTQIPLQHGVDSTDGSLYAKKHQMDNGPQYKLCYAYMLYMH